MLAMAQKIKFKSRGHMLPLPLKFQNYIAMNKIKISELLEAGSAVKVPSMPFSVTQLRNLAKAALRGRTTVTIVVEENLCDKDIENILEEAPTNVSLDLTHCQLH